MAEEEKKPMTKKRKEVFIYGNYRYYYGYRLDKTSKEDPRLRVFKKEWFQGKDCLDIGCNQGVITMSIAKNFACRRIVGIDIDGDLIKAAKWNLQKLAKSEASASRLPKSNFKANVADEQCDTEGKPSHPKSKNVQLSESTTSLKGCNLFKRVSFQTENFVEDLEGFSEQYDTVLCLSVSKWIHLNWGDDGLITLFAKVWRVLRPGGVFLFEPQPWQSYAKNRRVSETARQNFQNILLKPDLFEEILLDKIGFRFMEDVTKNLSGAVAGFERAIFAFTK